jgi:hypothetical protein
VVSFWEDAHDGTRLQSFHANVKNDVVAVANVCDSVPLPVNRHLVESVHDVSGYGVPEHIGPCKPVNLTRHERTRNERIHHAVLVVADDDGGFVTLRDVLKTMQSPNFVIAGHPSPYQDVGQAVVKV